MLKTSFKNLTQTKGTISVLVVISIIALLSMGALAVDLAHLYLARAELQDIADAAALAGASGLIIGTSEAINRAKEYAHRNIVAGEDFELEDEDIELGIWDFSNRTFTPTDDNPNAIRVTARRTEDSPKGKVPLLFANLFGKDKAAVVAQATAALEARDIVLVLDKSGSMEELTASGNTKIEDLLDSAENFVQLFFDNQIIGDQMGVVWYSRRWPGTGGWDTKLTSTLTNNENQVIDEGLYCWEDDFDDRDDFTTGGTCMSEGLDYGIKELNSSRAGEHSTKVIILMSDGNANTCAYPGKSPTILGYLDPDDCCPGHGLRDADGHGHTCCTDPPESPPWQPAQKEVLVLAERAHKQGIVVHTITLGIDVSIQFMEAVAEKGGGVHYHAPSGDDLDAIFQEIAKNIPISLAK